MPTIPMHTTMSPEEQALGAIRGLKETIAQLRTTVKELEEMVERKSKEHEQFVQTLLNETAEMQHTYPENVYPTISREIR